MAQSDLRGSRGLTLAVSRPTFSPVLKRFGRSHEFWLLAVILALCLVLSLATDSFLTLQNLFDLLTSNAFVGIMASGLLVVLIAGGIVMSAFVVLVNRLFWRRLYAMAEKRFTL